MGKQTLYYNEAFLRENFSRLRFWTKEMMNSIKVGVRIRPLVTREAGSRECVSVSVDTPSQVNIGTRSFSYDHVFGKGASQEEIYNTSVQSLVATSVEGYNVRYFIILHLISF